MTSAISLHSHNNIEAKQADNQTRPEFSGGTTLFAVMALYALQNLLLKVMKLYSKAVAEQKNISLDMSAKSGDNIKSAGAMQATSMILAGVGSIAGAAFAVGFTLYGTKALKQTQTEMKSVKNKLSIVDNNVKMMESANGGIKKADISKGEQKSPNSPFDRFDPMRAPVVRYSARNGGRVKFELNRRNASKNKNASIENPEIVSHSDLKPHLKKLEQSMSKETWDARDRRHLETCQQNSPEFQNLDKKIHSEQKMLNKRMDSLSGEHNAELNKATQRGQLSNSFAQGAGQTSSGIPHVAKGEYDSAAQFNKAVGEQIESSSRMSEEARNQTLQSANHINQILDQLKTAEKAN
ncbi:MAG: hypothetical protein ACRCSV_05610 [Chlamydiales bacterium]